MMLFPIERAKGFGNNYIFLGRILSKIVFSLKYDLKRAEMEIDAERYSLAALISAVIYGFVSIFIGLLFGVVITSEFGLFTISLMILFGVMGFIFSLIFHLYTPKIETRQLAMYIDQQLLFALRSMLIQLSSGMSLFETMNSISRGSYGQVSTEFGIVIKDINSGLSESEALERLAFRTDSEFLKKTVWQILTSVKSGGSIVAAVTVQIESLINHQLEAIKNYSAELNLWILIYLIIAAAVPSLGVTFLTIISSIGGSGVTREIVIAVVFLSILIQLAMITFLRTRVPKVIK